jgi:hypothetical protein
MLDFTRVHREHVPGLQDLDPSLLPGDGDSSTDHSRLNLLNYVGLLFKSIHIGTYDHRLRKNERPVRSAVHNSLTG